MRFVRFQIDHEVAKPDIAAGAVLGVDLAAHNALLTEDDIPKLCGVRVPQFPLDQRQDLRFLLKANFGLGWLQRHEWSTERTQY